MRNIAEFVFEPEYALSNNLVEMSRKELCALVAEICRQIKAESGNKTYHGGIYPENISRNPKGEIGFGPAKKREWNELELQYIAPEIYWNNRSTPQSDVYSLGLLLYYGASAGKLPFEGEAGNAQLMRMSGKTVYAPPAAGKHLGDIIEKALRFKENERYRNPEELAVMLDYCEDNRLLQKKSGAEAIFQKKETELSDLEQIMLKIIEGKADAELAAEPEKTEDDVLDQIVASVRDGEETREKTEDEMFSEAGLVRPKPAEKPPADNRLAELFGLDEPDPRDPAELEEEEDIRVYEPGNKKQQGIPILTEESDPELAPITVKNRKNTGKPVRTVQKTAQKPTQKQPKQEEVTQKKRPFLVVILLLAVLLIAAAVAKILISAFGDTGSDRGAATVAAVGQTTVQEDGSQTGTDTATDITAILSEEQIQQQQQWEQLQQEQQQQEAEAAQQATVEQTLSPVDPATLPHSYEAVRADVGWNQAQQEALSRGGYLVTVNSQEEFDKVVELAEQAGMDKVWIGGHRQDGNIVWESGEDVGFYRWDEGEPSYTDKGDGTAEDYVMLWKRGGIWCYNDSRENPLTDFYGMYGGRIGYVVEKVG